MTALAVLEAVWPPLWALTEPLLPKLQTFCPSVRQLCCAPGTTVTKAWSQPLHTLAHLNESLTPFQEMWG